jgi:hypothetical protein
MKHRTGLVFSAAAIVVLGVGFLVLQLMIDDVPVARASASGEILSPLALAKEERIEIDYSDAGCRSWHNWTFVLLGGKERRLAAIDNERPASTSDGGDRPAVVGAIALSERECAGMTDLLELYRHPDPKFYSTTTIRIRASYYRGTRKVGAEEFVDRGTVDDLLRQRDEEGQVPITSGVTPDLISFRDLMRRAATEANPAPP